MERRPSGITVLAATTMVAAILMIINGSILAAIPTQKISQFLGLEIQTPSYLAATIVYGLGVVMFMMGIASFFVAYGMLRGDSWARTTMVAFTSIGIGIFAAAALFNIVEVASLVINGSILLYLFKPNVRSYFKTTRPAASQTQST